MFNDYLIEVWYSKDDSAYLARIPEIQGCIADGQTREEAIQELEVVYNLCIESAEAHGDYIPDPDAQRMAI